MGVGYNAKFKMKKRGSAEFGMRDAECAVRNDSNAECAFFVPLFESRLLCGILRSGTSRRFVAGRNAE